MKWFRFPRILGIIVCLYLVGLAALFANLSMQSSRFVHQAGSTPGTVVALVARSPAGGNRTTPASTRTVSLAPRVSYVVDGRTYDYTASHGRLRHRLKVGDQVQVQYDVADPARARLRGEGRVLVPGITAGFGLAALGVAVLLVRTRHVGLGTGKTPRRDVPALGEVEHPTAR